MHSITKAHTLKRLRETAPVTTSVNIFLPSFHLTSWWKNKSTLCCEFIHRIGVAQLIAFKWHNTSGFTYVVCFCCLPAIKGVFESLVLKREAQSRESPLSGVSISMDAVYHGNDGCLKLLLCQISDKLIFVIVPYTEADTVHGSWAPTGKSVLIPSFLIWGAMKTLWTDQMEYWLTCVARWDLWLRRVTLGTQLRRKNL